MDCDGQLCEEGVPHTRLISLAGCTLSFSSTWQRVATLAKPASAGAVPASTPHAAHTAGYERTEPAASHEIVKPNKFPQKCGVLLERTCHE